MILVLLLMSGLYFVLFEEKDERTGENNVKKSSMLLLFGMKTACRRKL